MSGRLWFVLGMFAVGLIALDTLLLSGSSALANNCTSGCTPFAQCIAPSQGTCPYCYNNPPTTSCGPGTSQGSGLWLYQNGIGGSQVSTEQVPCTTVYPCTATTIPGICGPTLFGIMCNGSGANCQSCASMPGINNNPKDSCKDNGCNENG